VVHYAAAPTAVTSSRGVPCLASANRTMLAGMDWMDRMDGAREDVAEHGMFGWEGPQLPTRSTRLCLAQGRLSTLAIYTIGAFAPVKP
jgi:hypothetical protein